MHKPITNQLPPQHNREIQHISSETDKATLRALYLAFVLVHLLMLTITLSRPEDGTNWAYAAISVTTGLGAIFYSYRHAESVLNPATLFAAVWLILVPTASGPIPLMRAMHTSEVVVCLVLGLVYSLTGLVIGLPTKKARPGNRDARRCSGSSFEWTTAAFILIGSSLIALAVNLLLNSGIALVRDDPQARKAFGAFTGYWVLASVGSVGIAIVAFQRRALAGARLLYLLTCTYLLLHLLSGQRFVAIVTLLIASIIAVCTSNSKRRQSHFLLIAGGLVLACFGLVSMFRGGSSDHEIFFVSTGIYDRDVALLNATEIVRYVGMSQRNMSTVLESEGRPFEYTKSLLLHAYDSDTRLGTSTHGYTANNIVSYLHHDFGELWPLAVAFLAVIVHLVYRQHRARTRSFFWAFAWGVAGMGVILSFFAYINAYSYWVVLFPGIAALIGLIAYRDNSSALRPGESDQRRACGHKT